MEEIGESFELLALDQISDFPPEQDMEKHVVPSNAPVSDDESGNEMVDQPSAMEQSDHHPPSLHYEASGSSWVGPSFQANRPLRGSYIVSHSSSTANQRFGAVNHRSSGRPWNDNNRYRSQGNGGRSGEFGESNEVVSRGPRSIRGRDICAKPTTGRPKFYRTKYNSEDFQTEYEDAKFYIIKSFKEDDVHKAIKYNVWSSTPHGNRKLEAVFAETEAKTWETGKPCPIFLLFSVNASSQFVGVAEMVAPVDFNKDLDFWHDEHWKSFFPITWHIIKDVPNAQFWHIILENNQGKPVTNSRDTQEIELAQGMEMLRIFKNYADRTSIMDYFSFYEEQERSVGAKRRAAKKAASRSRA